MNFLNPLMLLGLAAASIPLILHLLNLRRQKTVEFSSLRFLKELQKTKIRKIKLKQILLLILRTLIIIFAVMAFARPTMQSSIPFMENYAQTSTIIIIDNSFSMDVSDENGNRFTQARSLTHNILNRLREGDEALIIEAANLQKRSQYSFSRNRSYLTDRISQISISHSKAQLIQSLKLASLALEDAANINREIFIISDAQNNTFETEDTTALNFGNTAIYLLPIGYNSRADIQNLSIDSINIITGIFQLDKPVEMEVNLKNHSRTDIPGAVVSLMFNDERVAQRSIDIPAEQNRSIVISAKPQFTGAIKATVELESDALEHDNKRFFGFIIPENPKVAVVGERRNRFLNIALQGSKHSQIAEVNNYTINQFSAIDISLYDIVVLTDGNFTNSDYTRIHTYVENGGAAIFFAGSQANDPLFITQMNKFGFGDLKPVRYGYEQSGNFTRIDLQHPIFQGVFETTDTEKSIEAPDMETAFLAVGGQAIIEMSNGNFLSESRIGDGKVFYFAVSSDLSRSNFPMTGLFPALMYRSVFYLTSAEDVSRQALIDEEIKINLPRKLYTGGNFTIIDPMGNEFFEEPVLLPSGVVLSMNEPNLPGNYVIKNPRGNVVSMMSLNTTSSESDLSRVDKKYITETITSRIADKSQFFFVEQTGNLETTISRARMGTELWQLFILLAFLAAIAELIVQRVSKNEIEE